ncbi:putative bifunctional diguanylate cyclase/phosphodiesterase [Ciceribacter azotifigens]|uniref:putative bifunctional diguanylate cyclase/phosphodiesterase n=1 Tax=Ciceribacter azotifigens TaxID=2069303 RepID=UPI003A860B32
MTRSVESRFLAIIAIAVGILVIPLLALFLALSSERSARELNDHVEILLAANAQALAKPLWDFDVESAEQITAAIVSDDAITKVRVRDVSGGISVSMPPMPNWPKSGVQSLSRPIVYKTLDGPKTVGLITVYFHRLGVFSTLREAEGIFIGIFIIAILAMVGAAILGNRIMIVKPLLKLTAAIEATRRLGSRHHVDWNSNDEMGRLAQSFNAMQTQLEQEERELKIAHRRATDIYNLTPAMLFSIDENDRITDVSDYWLLATGYARDEVIARHFAELVDAEVRDEYLVHRERPSDRKVVECTTKFVCKDGRVMDVLIVESGKAARDGETGLSLSVMTDVTELKRSEARVRRQAVTDHLTGLLNRQGFEGALDDEIRETDARQGELACIFVDLDRFKWINDNLGHQAGDTVLCRLVELMGRQLPPAAIAARIGGDEFAILLRSNNAETDALALAHRLCGMLEEPLFVSGSTVRLSASIGVALYPRHAHNAAELLQKSDMAMYTKKRDGKNGALLYDPLFQDTTRQRAEIEQDIEEALRNDWFEAYFQPIVDLGDGHVTGYEALMRLNHPRKGLLPPSDIIRIAEETGAIGRIGNRVFEKGLANLVALTQASGDDRAYLAVNFSPLQLEPALPMLLTALTARHGIDPQRLVIEITEATLLHDNPQIRMVLDEFSRIGCRIALDDFGTGYSSLSYLSRFPVDIVKIDQSFIRSLASGEAELRDKSRMLVEGITAISHKMECSVTAEGIETTEQRDLLREFGVDCGQGYLFARPQPVEQLIAAYDTTRKVTSVA